MSVPCGDKSWSADDGHGGGRLLRRAWRRAGSVWAWRGRDIATLRAVAPTSHLRVPRLADAAASVLQRTENKIGQLTRVIHHLSARGGESSLNETASAYENEVSDIRKDVDQNVTF